MEVANVISKNRGKAKNRLTTFTIGTNSDVSTTVMAHSQAANRRFKKHPSSSMGANNFANLGAGLINDTPRSKQSVDLGMGKRAANRQNSLYKNNTTATSKSNLAIRDSKHNRRTSMLRSFSRQNIKGRASTRNLINPGGLTHSNFI